MTLPEAIKAMPAGGRIRRSHWNEIESIDPFVDYYNWTVSDNEASDWCVQGEDIELRIEQCSPQTIGMLF